MEEPYQPLDRRPIASRELKLSGRAAAALARRNVSPNAISVAGMLSGLVAGAGFAWTATAEDTWLRVAWFIAAVGIQLRLVANLLDGMVAIESERASPLGELYNEVPDRVSDAATLIGAGYALGGHVVLGYAAASVAILTAYMRAVGKVVGGTQEYCGPMAKQHRMFLLTIVALYCALTPPGWQPTWSRAATAEASAPHGLVAAALAAIILGGLWTALRRLRRVVKTLQRSSAS